MEGKIERISKGKGWQMIGTAIFLDVIGIIPGVNYISDAAFVILFSLWFNAHGAPFSKNRSMLWWTIVFGGIGLIPFVSDILPEITIAVVRNVLYIQKQDRKKSQQIMRINAEASSATSPISNSLSNSSNYNGEPVIRRIGPQSSQAQRGAVDNVRKAA